MIPQDEPGPDAAARPGEWGTATRVCLGLGVLVLCIYARTIMFDFVRYDDGLYVYQNQRVKQGLTGSNVVWAFTERHGVNWHPLTTISHMLDVQLYGLQPGFHHLTNVWLHALTAMLLFLALRRLSGSLWPSALAAALFAVHPLRVESVAWIAERKDVFSGFFFALTLFAYGGYARRPSVPRYLFVVLAFVLGLLSKPMLVTVPFVLLLLDYWPLSRFEARPRAFQWLLLEKAPLFLLSAASCAMTVWAQKAAVAEFPEISPWLRLGNAAVSYAVYLRQLFWPAQLACLYPYPIDHLPLWEPVAALALVLALSLGALVQRRRRPYLLVGWLWYLGMLVPAIGLVQVGPQAHADRYTYLPQIGLIVALVWWAADLSGRWQSWRPVRGAAAVGLLLVLTWVSWRQTGYWRNGMELFSHAVACTTGNAIAHNNYGCELDSRGKHAEAAEQFAKAIAAVPHYGNALCNYGLALMKFGRNEEAVVYFQRAVRLDRAPPGAGTLLGEALYRSGKPREALAVWRAALRQRPDDVACLALAAWVAATSEVAEARSGADAVAWSERADQLTGGQVPEILDGRAASYAECGRFREAIEIAGRAIELAKTRERNTFVDRVTAHRDIYRAGRPLREPPATFESAMDGQH